MAADRSVASGSDPRFWRRVDRSAGPDVCWPWLGYVVGGKGGGHGQVRRAGRLWGAHAYAYALVVGPIPAGLDVGHVCHDEDKACPGGPSCLHRRCCNPAHLRLQTRRENCAAGRHYASRTECSYGHPYTVENTYIRKDDGSRMCRACNARRQRETQRRKREGK